MFAGLWVIQITPLLTGVSTVSTVFGVPVIVQMVVFSGCGEDLLTYLGFFLAGKGKYF